MDGLQRQRFQGLRFKLPRINDIQVKKANMTKLEETLARAMQQLLDELLDAGDDRHPETRTEYKSYKFARRVCAVAQRRRLAEQNSEEPSNTPKDSPYANGLRQAFDNIDKPKPLRQFSDSEATGTGNAETSGGNVQTTTAEGLKQA